MLVIIVIMIIIVLTIIEMSHGEINFEILNFIFNVCKLKIIDGFRCKKYLALFSVGPENMLS